MGKILNTVLQRCTRHGFIGVPQRERCSLRMETAILASS
jgi:hypothetical protein